MKGKKISVLLAFGLNMCVAAAQEARFTVTVHMAAGKPGRQLYLLYRRNADSKAFDSARDENGKFTFSGKTLHPQKAFLCLPAPGKTVENTPLKEAFPLYLEKGNIVVIAGETLKHARVGGTTLNNDLQAYNHLEDSLTLIKDALRERYGKAYRDKNKDSLQVVTEAFYQLERDQLQCEVLFFQQHTHSHVALEWLKNAYNIPQEKSKVVNLFAQLGDNVKQSFSGQAFQAELAAAASVELGSPAPVFSEKDTTGLAVSLQSFRGKYVLLDFWASWCGPCRKENPNVLKMYKAFQSKGFTVLGFSVDDSPERWMAAVVKDSLPWCQLRETGAGTKKVADVYGVKGIPSNFLIDPNGNIIATNLRGQELEDTLTAVFSRQQPVVKASKKDAVAAGLDMTRYTFEDKEGNAMNLKNYTGKYIMMDIWASWCYPCKKEFPAFDSLKAAFKEKNIVFLQVSCDESKRRWINEMGFTRRMYDQYIASDKAFLDELQVYTIPRYLLIDTKGKLINAYMTRASDPVTAATLLQLKGI
ncbi:Peroxiredoxin [Filimonas lacunae]|uniref:Peroxiredoxin n=1 Tax=Filimonas lacunae TaxID=477680 RepID=A0A173MID2_9BACT|nr:TlpA disulfide reductase family protein [Filimonas lacunae]BAV07355.1 thioredoxin family protein [Filimonas lacunae]SIS90880.1 Peroxiredoxin [Filimonas lacunae]